MGILSRPLFAPLIPHCPFGWLLLRIHTSCNLRVTNRYQMKQVQIRLTDEERIDTIYQPVCQNALPLPPLLTRLLRRIPDGRTCQDAKSKTEPAIRSSANSQESESQSIQALSSTFKHSAKHRSKPRHCTLRGQFLRS